MILFVQGKSWSYITTDSQQARDEMATTSGVTVHEFHEVKEAEWEKLESL